MRRRRTNHLIRACSPTGTASDQHRVVVVEDHPFAADDVAGELASRGDAHLAWCRDDRGDVTCEGVVNDGCPLLGHVDLVLDVRRGTGDLAAGELGVACAGVAGLPVVVAGPTRPPLGDAPWAVATCSSSDAAAFCGHLLAHPDAWVELRLEDLARRILRMRHEDVGRLDVRLLRWPSAVTLVVRSDFPLTPGSCDAVSGEMRALRPRPWPDDVETAVSFSTA
jgi:hypothetical protein